MVPEDRLILFKVGACDYETCAWNNVGGAWYDHRYKTSETGFPILSVRDTDNFIVWDSLSDAIGYQIYFSHDLGTTFPENAIVGNVNEYDYPDDAGNSKIFYYGCAIYSDRTACRRWAGGYYGDTSMANGVGRHVYWEYGLKSVILYK
jgi:hypothetical protein